MCDPDLARYESALLALLAEDLAPSERRAALHRRADFAPYQRYVSQLDDRFLDVATGLVRRWGRRSMPGAFAPRPRAAASL